jgi:hypothetical protein
MNNDTTTTDEYDELLQDFLLQNGCNIDNITDVCRSGVVRKVIDKRWILEEIRLWQAKSGCLFTLPGKRRDNHCYLCWSPMSSNEIRRTVALKAFL